MKAYFVSQKPYRKKCQVQNVVHVSTRCSAYSIFAIDSIFGTEHAFCAILKQDHNS